MKPDCGHLLCELIDSSCSLATHRSRGCRPGLAEKSVALEVFEEVRALIAIIDPDASAIAGHDAPPVTRRNAAATDAAATDAAATDAAATDAAATDAAATDAAAHVREAAIRLAAIVRREALEDRNLLAQVRADEPDLAPALARLCVRRR